LAPDGRRALGKSGLIALVLLAGCSTPAAEQQAPRTVERAQLNPPVGSRMPTAQTTDVCKAGELQYLVGRQRTEIPVPVDVVNRRVTCTTCPVTHDFSAYRLNIFYNAETGVIEQVRCG
jgi:hypothetical protein